MDVDEDDDEPESATVYHMKRLGITSSPNKNTPTDFDFLQLVL